MFNLFGKGRKQTDRLPPKLPFKSNEAAFEYSCQFMKTDIQEGAGLIALVLDARAEFDAPNPVKIDAAGFQTATIRVSSKDGGFAVPSRTLISNAPPLAVGDLVIWQVASYLKEYGAQIADRRGAWVGVIVGVLERTMDTATGRFDVKHDYYEHAHKR